MIDAITYVSNIEQLAARLAAHYEAKTEYVYEHIQSDGEAYWFKDFFQTGVLRLEGETLCCEKLANNIAESSFDENGELIRSSFFDLLNINPENGEPEPVIDVWATGNTRTDDTPYNKLTDAQKDKLRQFWPEFVTYEIDGEEFISERGLEWERLI